MPGLRGGTRSWVSAGTAAPIRLETRRARGGEVPWPYLGEAREKGKTGWGVEGGVRVSQGFEWQGYPCWTPGPRGEKFIPREADRAAFLGSGVEWRRCPYAEKGSSVGGGALT